MKPMHRQSLVEGHFAAAKSCRYDPLLRMRRDMATLLHNIDREVLSDVANALDRDLSALTLPARRRLVAIARIVCAWAQLHDEIVLEMTADSTTRCSGWRVLLADTLQAQAMAEMTEAREFDAEATIRLVGALAATFSESAARASAPPREKESDGRIGNAYLRHLLAALERPRQVRVANAATGAVIAAANAVPAAV